MSTTIPLVTEDNKTEIIAPKVIETPRKTVSQLARDTRSNNLSVARATKQKRQEEALKVKNDIIATPHYDTSEIIKLIKKQVTERSESPPKKQKSNVDESMHELLINMNNRINKLYTMKKAKQVYKNQSQQQQPQIINYMPPQEDKKNNTAAYNDAIRRITQK